MIRIILMLVLWLLLLGTCEVTAEWEDGLKIHLPGWLFKH